MQIFQQSPLLFRIVYSLALVFKIPVGKEIHNVANNVVYHSEDENMSTTSEDGSQLCLKEILPTCSEMSFSLWSKCLPVFKKEFQLLNNSAKAKAIGLVIETTGKHNVANDDISHVGSYVAISWVLDGLDLLGTCQVDRVINGQSNFIPDI